MPGQDLCLLSLDGGGVRGLSSLLILQELKERLCLEDPSKPCDVFDMIGGTILAGTLSLLLRKKDADATAALIED